MKKILLIALLLIVGCSKPVEESTLINKDGLMYLPDSDSPYTGEVFTNYDTGEKLYTGRYENGLLIEYSYLKKDGTVKEPINYETTLIERDDLFYTKDTNKPYSGPIFSLFEDGKIKDEGTLKNGKKDGDWIINKYKDHPFKFVLTYEDGKITGDEYAIDGLANKVVLKNNLVDNDGQKYERNIITPYTGPVMELWKYPPALDGKIKLMGYYNNGLRDGNWQFWHDIFEKPIMLGNYKNGTAINWEITTDPDTNIRSKFDLTKTSNKTKGFTKTNSDEIIIDYSWLRIKVYAQQYVWNIHYSGPDGYFGSANPHLIDEQDNPIGLDRSSEEAADDIVTMNQLHIPTNTNVLLEITTKLSYAGEPLEDLSEFADLMDELHHILLIPELNLLQEARLGVWNNMLINVENTGDYIMRCVNYCGIGSYRHKGFLTVQKQNEFQDWLYLQAEYLENEEDDWGDDDW